MRKLLQLRFTFILVPAIILLLVFLSGFTGKTASADMSGQHTMESYENVFIKSGDTLPLLIPMQRSIPTYQRQNMRKLLFH